MVPSQSSNNEGTIKMDHPTTTHHQTSNNNNQPTNQQNVHSELKNGQIKLLPAKFAAETTNHNEILIKKQFPCHHITTHKKKTKQNSTRSKSNT